MHKKSHILKELCDDQPCKSGGDYCILKEILLHDSKYNDRLLVQAGCVNKFKYEQSIIEKKDIGWSDAWILWVETGKARLFGVHYVDGDTVAEVYKKIINE